MERNQASALIIATQGLAEEHNKTPEPGEYQSFLIQSVQKQLTVHTCCAVLMA